MSEKQLKLPISVCILVKNEESNLINSLPALSIFKEVLVYDSGSIDSSIELCKKYNAKIIKGEWLGFSQSRKKLFSPMKLNAKDLKLIDWFVFTAVGFGMESGSLIGT